MAEVLIPFFAAGLHQGEQCIWAVPASLGTEGARTLLARSVPDLEKHLASSMMRLESADTWYQQLLSKETGEIAKQLSPLFGRLGSQQRCALRLAGDVGGVRHEDWTHFMAIERAANHVCADSGLVGLCCYSETCFTIPELVQAANYHKATLLRVGGKWTWLDAAEPILGQEQDTASAAAPSATGDAVRAIQAALKDSEEQFRIIFEEAPIGIGVYDHHGRIRFINRACREIFGLTEASAWYSLFEDPNITVDGRERLRRGKPLRYEGAFDFDAARSKADYASSRAGQGHLEVNIAPLGQPGQAPSGYILIFADITTRKLAEEALRKSEAKYRTLFESSLDGNAVVSSQGTHVLLANEAMARMLGVSSAKQLVGQDLLDFVCPADRDSACTFLRSEIFHPESKATRRFRTISRKAGELWVSAMGMATDYDGAAAGLVSFRDVTQSEHFHRKLNELYRKEKEALAAMEEENRRRSEYLRALVHELKTPLTPVLAASDALQHNLPTGPAQDLARKISQGAARLNSRIDELVDMGRGELGSLRMIMEPLDVIELLVDVSEEMSGTFKARNQVLVFKLPIDLPPVLADRRRIHQVMLNLLSNAFKYTPEGGKVVVEARCAKGEITVRVTDSGPGIPPPMRDKLFDPYERPDTAKHSGGLGTGLALSKMIVELHGGHIRVRSQEGKGSTFSFSLPLHEGQSLP